MLFWLTDLDDTIMAFTSQTPEDALNNANTTKHRRVASRDSVGQQPAPKTLVFTTPPL